MADAEGYDKYAMDLESFTKMRIANAAGHVFTMTVELANSHT